jgi:hypothetical protein
MKLPKMPLKKQEAFDVHLHGKRIDTVFATGYTVDEMKTSLINHDGYNPSITVRKAR